MKPPPSPLSPGSSHGELLQYKALRFNLGVTEASSGPEGIDSI